MVSGGYKERQKGQQRGHLNPGHKSPSWHPQPCWSTAHPQTLLPSLGHSSGAPRGFAPHCCPSQHRPHSPGASDVPQSGAASLGSLGTAESARPQFPAPREANGLVVSTKSHKKDMAQLGPCAHLTPSSSSLRAHTQPMQSPKFLLWHFTPLPPPAPCLLATGAYRHHPSCASDLPVPSLGHSPRMGLCRTKRGKR